MTDSDEQLVMRIPCAISKYHNPILTKPSKQIHLKDDVYNSFMKDQFFFDFFHQKIAIRA